MFITKKPPPPKKKRKICYKQTFVYSIFVCEEKAREDCSLTDCWLVNSYDCPSNWRQGNIIDWLRPLKWLPSKFITLIKSKASLPGFFGLTCISYVLSDKRTNYNGHEIKYTSSFIYIFIPFSIFTYLLCLSIVICNIWIDPCWHRSVFALDLIAVGCMSSWSRVIRKIWVQRGSGNSNAACSWYPLLPVPKSFHNRKTLQLYWFIEFHKSFNFRENTYL